MLPGVRRLSFARSKGGAYSDPAPNSTLADHGSLTATPRSSGALGGGADQPQPPSGAMQVPAAFRPGPARERAAPSEHREPREPFDLR